MINTTSRKGLLTDLRNSNPLLKKLSRTRFSYKTAKSILEKFSNDPLAMLAYEEVASFFKQNEKKTVRWFFAENPMLGGIRPIEMIIMGRQKKLMQFILDQKEGRGE